jgi:hypothetical protein
MVSPLYSLFEDDELDSLLEFFSLKELEDSSSEFSLSYSSSLIGIFEDFFSDFAV